MKKKVFIIPAIAVAAISLFLIINFTNNSPEHYKVEKREFQEKIVVSGVVKSPEVINISSEVTGKVLERFKDEGDIVNEGEPLLKIDDTQILLSISQEKERLKSLESQLKKMDTTDLDTVKSQVETAKLNLALSQNEEAKFKKLFDKNLVSELDYNPKKTKYLQDRNIFIESSNRLKSITTGEDRKNLLISIENSNLMIKKLEDELNKFLILSPASGVITDKNIEIGEIIAPKENIFEISKSQDKILEVDLDEKYISKIENGQSVEIFFPNDSGIRSEGIIYFVAPYVNKNNGTVKVKMKIKDPKPQFLYNINLNGIISGKSYHDSVIIPERFLYLKDGKSYVYLMKNGKISLKEVKTHVNYFQDVPILEGLEAGDDIVYPDDRIKKKVGFTHYE